MKIQQLSSAHSLTTVRGKGTTMAKLNTVLLEYAKRSRALADLLKDDPPLTAVDQLLIENHLEVVQLAYSAWTRQHGVRDQEDPPAQEISGA